MQDQFFTFKTSDGIGYIYKVIGTSACPWFCANRRVKMMWRFKSHDLCRWFRIKSLNFTENEIVRIKVSLYESEDIRRGHHFYRNDGKL